MGHFETSTSEIQCSSSVTLPAFAAVVVVALTGLDSLAQEPFLDQCNQLSLDPPSLPASLLMVAAAHAPFHRP